MTSDLIAPDFQSQIMKVGSRDIAGNCHQMMFVFQIVDIINENEAHFLSSLQQGSRLIERTLSRKDYKHGVFPGQSRSRL